MEFKADFELYPTGGTKLDCKNPLWSFSWRLGAEMNTFQFWPKVRNYRAGYETTVLRYETTVLMLTVF